MGSQVSMVHGFPSLQLSAMPCVQLPFWHVSLPLHTLASLHEVPFGTTVCLQPATGSQVSVVQGLLSLQVSDVPAVQAPAWHVSTPLHTLPSLHEVPSGTAVCLQPVAGSHVSVVHAFASSHFNAVPAAHTPA